MNTDEFLHQRKPHSDFSILELQKALVNKEFLLHYQPLIEGRTGKIVGFEALIRWNHPQFGILYPDSFIQTAESTGFINPLGKWVIETACSQVKKWETQFKESFRISINVSDKQLTDKTFTSGIKKLLEKIRFEPSLVVLEITERTTSSMEVLSKAFDKLRESGIKISIDDFGTGYNSIYYLKELPFDQLKIDRSFTHDLTSKKEQIIVDSIIDIAKKLKLEIVAEGIETKNEYRNFKEKVELLQGYFFAKPLPVKETERHLEERFATSIR